MSIDTYFLNTSLGKIGTNKNDIKIKDYVEFKQSNALGRLFIQIKLFWNGKGWLNKKSANKLLQKMNWETMENIYSKNQEILNMTGKGIKDTEMTFAGDLKKFKKRTIKQIKKKATIATPVKKLIDKRVKEKDDNIRKDLTPLNDVKLDDFKSDNNLGPIFQDYLDLLTKTLDRDWRIDNPIHENYNLINNAHEVVRKYGTSIYSKNEPKIPKPTEKKIANVAYRIIDFDKIDNLNKTFLVNGFLEYLVEGIVENKFTPEEKRNIRLAIVARKLDSQLDNKEFYFVTKNIINNADNYTGPQNKMELSKKEIDSLIKLFPSKEFEPLIKMFREIATANAQETLEPYVKYALSHFFNHDKHYDCNKGTDLLELIQTTYKIITLGKTTKAILSPYDQESVEKLFKQHTILKDSYDHFVKEQLETADKSQEIQSEDYRNYTKYNWSVKYPFFNSFLDDLIDRKVSGSLSLEPQLEKVMDELTKYVLSPDQFKLEVQRKAYFHSKWIEISEKKTAQYRYINTLVENPEFAREAAQLISDMSEDKSDNINQHFEKFALRFDQLKSKSDTIIKNQRGVEPPDIYKKDFGTAIYIGSGIHLEDTHIENYERRLKALDKSLTGRDKQSSWYVILDASRTFVKMIAE